MNTQEQASNLRAAADLIRRGWNRGAFAVDKDGNGIDLDNIGSPHAVAWCAQGAMYRAVWADKAKRYDTDWQLLGVKVAREIYRIGDMRLPVPESGGYLENLICANCWLPDSTPAEHIHSQHIIATAMDNVADRLDGGGQKREPVRRSRRARVAVPVLAALLVLLAVPALACEPAAEAKQPPVPQTSQPAPQKSPSVGDIAVGTAAGTAAGIVIERGLRGVFGW